ncbi:MAG: UDP-N-acetylglucosamine diphosphorylase [Candidatus Hydrogenedentota bacterium]|nr:MAG: UDP-N-acetylglucosamine diphosphorylase [Candidatus Hydrogenedentota bacterium]
MAGHECSRQASSNRSKKGGSIKLTGVILAAGKGTRMKSELPKVLHSLWNKPLIHHVLEKAYLAGLRDFVVVIGYKKELVEDSVANWQSHYPDVEIQFAVQEEQKGTGHAVQCAMPYVAENSDILVLLGDVPNLDPEEIQDFTYLCKQQNSSGVMSMILDNPYGYGRIVRSDNGENFARCIREEKDATEEERNIQEVNTGIFYFLSSHLHEHLQKLNANNAQGEYYLTDMVELLHRNQEPVIVYTAKDPNRFAGINSREDLKQMEEGIHYA